MKMQILVIILLFSVISMTKSDAQISRYEEISNLKSNENWPTIQDQKKLLNELTFQRGSQVYLWALPLLNTMAMKQGSENHFGSGYNILPIWKKRLGPKTLITTPNSDVIYAMTFLDLGKDGPLVIEAPPKMQGILLDFWQRPIQGPMIKGQSFRGDIGFFGPDDGKGGKYLILPPNYQSSIPEGYYVYNSDTNNLFVFFRSFYHDPNNLKQAVNLVEQTKIYPLNHKNDIQAMKFPDASELSINMLPSSDFHAFEQLKYLIDTESNNLADADWLGMLAAIGIAKDKDFNPIPEEKNILNLAAKTGYQISRALATADEIDGISYQIYPNLHWVNPFAGNSIGLDWMKTNTSYRALNSRSNFFTNYYSISPGMVSHTPGKGANYMMAFKDSDGDFLSGNRNYVIKLPSNVPVANFWSITLYEASHSSGLNNGQSFPSFGSLNNPNLNSDGSIDVYIGPEAPKNKSKNWIPTVPEKGFFSILRLYSPTDRAFDRSWIPGDFKKIDNK